MVESRRTESWHMTFHNRKMNVNELIELIGHVQEFNLAMIKSSFSQYMFPMAINVERFSNFSQ